MTPPLTGQRSRSELIAELYERHASGLFAYCHDQLGQTTPAADAVVAVFTTAPTAEPPSRAALYVLARREIYRRDVSYALPAVDSVADPATALIERVFRDIRPHQREVLLLSEVCGLTAPELSLVLDVAVDTAEELISGATRRFAQTLETAVTAARSAPFVPASVAEVYDAIGVSPVGDVLARLPWCRPAASVRDRVLTALPYEEPGSAAAGQEHSSGLVTKRLWPTTPTWPLPLSDPDQVTNTCVVKTDAIAQPQGTRRKAKHEATTEPMPRLRGALLNPLGEGRLRRRRPGRPAPTEPQAALAAPVEPQESPQEPAQTASATPPATLPAAPSATPSATPPAPAVAETAANTFDAFRQAGPFDAFGVSEAPHRADPFEAFGAPPRPAEPLLASDTPLRPAEPLLASDTPLRPAEPFDAFGTAPRPAEPYDAFGAMPRPGEPFDATGAVPGSAEPFDASGNTPRPAEPFDAFGGTAAARPGDPLDALFDTLRFAEPFDAFRTAETAGTPPQAEPAEPTEAPAQSGMVAPAPAAEEATVFPPAFPPAFPQSVEFPLPPAEPIAPASVRDDVRDEVPDEPPSERDGEHAAHTFGTEADILVHPVVAAVSVPLPAAPRRPGRRHAGKPSGDGGASKGRRAKGDRHYDWLWEVVGILICLVIALAVFYFVQ
ncbi:RNA polymerase sigma factor [Microbispora sp. H13382]|uniref:RNA polymerase sigma factor n=1 Tax=Microbispora sp. H13382 TaxID=2729112 RepID=UPI0016041690|nr:sigma-70 family RNA polymerase sigma factor [Microbispora sp. H13382]